MPNRILGALTVVVVLLSGPALAKHGEKVVRLKVGPFPILANRDREICQAIKVPHVAGMEIASWEARSRISNLGNTGSHHLVVYGYSGTDSTQFPKGVEDDPGCANFGPPDFFKARVFLSGSGGESGSGHWSVTRASWPGDLAQVVPAPKDAPSDAWIIVNSHYFNQAPKVGHGLVKVTLHLRTLDPRKRLIHQVIHGDASEHIMLPPETKSDPQSNPVRAAFRADGAPNYQTEGGKNPRGDVCLFVVSTHMHKRGTRFLIEYAENGQVETLLDWPDWLHAGTVLFPGLSPIAAEPTSRHAGLLPAYTAENGWPELRYSCEYANGVDGRELKMGCEETPGVTPGSPWDGISDSTLTHAKPCGKDGVNCDGKPCVPANLVFGPLSDDDMCIFTAETYDPLPGVPPDQACQLRYLD